MKSFQKYLKFMIKNFPIFLLGILFLYLVIVDSILHFGKKELVYGTALVKELNYFPAKRIEVPIITGQAIFNMSNSQSEHYCAVVEIENELKNINLTSGQYDSLSTRKKVNVIYKKSKFFGDISLIKFTL